MSDPEPPVFMPDFPGVVPQINDRWIYWARGEIALLQAKLARCRETLTSLMENGHFYACLAGKRGSGTCSLACERIKAALDKAEG